MTSATQRTLALLRADRKIVQIVEHWNQFAHRRIDLFGFIDIVALDAAAGLCWGVQCTTATNKSARLHKILGECYTTAVAWLECGNRIELVTWSKRGAAGKRKLWSPMRLQIATVGELVGLRSTHREPING